MATTVHALAREVSSYELTSNDQIILKHNVLFFRNVDGTVTAEQAEIECTFAATALVATINDKITDAAVAAATSLYGWTLPRNNFIYPTVARGVVV